MGDREERLRTAAGVLAVLAGIGFVLSLFVHVAALFGRAPLGGAAWGLHVDALAVGPPSICALLKAAGKPSRHWWMGRQLDATLLVMSASAAPHPGETNR